MTRPRRITVASSGLGHVARGIEAWAADLGRALASRGENVVLCKGGGELLAPYERGVSCWQREAPRTQRLLRWLPRRLVWRLGLGSGYGVEQVSFALNLLGHLRRDQVDILHVQDPLVAALVQRAHGLGLVSTRTILAHGTEEPHSFQKEITYLQHLAPWHLAEARAAGVERPTWTAIPNFINTEHFRPGRADDLRAELGIPADGLVLLTAAAIKRKHKRIDYLLGEFETLRRLRPDLPVWLVVAGGWEPETEALLEEGRARLGERVRFLVRHPRSRMADLYRAGDVFTLCSLKEMMPIALLEAAASGLPTVVHHHPVMKWVVGAGGQALDLSVPGALAAAWAQLLTDPGLRHRLARQARRHCVEEFGEDQVIGCIKRYYEFVLTHDRQPSHVVTLSRPTGALTSGGPGVAVLGANLPAAGKPPTPPGSVSVIIPTFNSADFVTAAVESVLGQTRSVAEIIVVDDGSTDDTRERLGRYRDRIRYIYQENQGVSAARNRGVRAATGDFIAFLDADDTWHPRKIELQLSAFEQFPEVGMLGTRVFDWAGGIPAVGEGLDPVVAPIPLKRLLVKNYFVTSSLLIRRSLLERVGEFDATLQGPEDYDCWLRVARLAPVANLALSLTGYRNVPGSLSKDAVRMQAGMRRILQKLDERNAWEGDRLLRCKAYSYCDFSCAYMYTAAGDRLRGLGLLLRSLLRYPLPYARGEVRTRFSRPKHIVMNLWRLIRGQNPEPLPASCRSAGRVPFLLGK